MTNLGTTAKHIDIVFTFIAWILCILHFSTKLDTLGYSNHAYMITTLKLLMIAFPVKYKRSN